MIDYNAFFDNISVKRLVGTYNTCALNWTEVNVRYNFHKFYYFTGGEGQIKVGNDIFYPQPGDLYYIPAHTVHSHRHNPANPVGQHWSHFEADLTGGYHFFYNRNSFFCRPPKEITESLFIKLNSDRLNPFFAIESKIALLELMKLFLENVKGELILHSDKTSMINKIDSYILNHIQDDICLADLAAVVNRQANYFISSFKKAYGFTPIEYLNTVRMKEAHRLWNDTFFTTQEQTGY